MLSKKVEEALNKQINAEFWSGYLYLSMSAHFAKEGNQALLIGSKCRLWKKMIML